jgi:hypothetical protein
LHSLIVLVTARSRNTNGFLADAIVELALTGQLAGRQVEIISTHFDTDIGDRVGDVHARLHHLMSASLEDCADGLPPDGLAPSVVPLLRMHGRPGEPSKQRLVIGEADFFVDDPVGDAPHSESHVARPNVVLHAMKRGDVLFVGSSLSEPGVLSVVAAHRHLPGRRYAILLSPDFAGKLSGPGHFDERALALDLLARRYLHIGVTPIIVDFEQQVPQVLREVAFRIAPGPAGYRPYAERLDDWWGEWASILGFGIDGSGDGRLPQVVRARWRLRLSEIRDHIATLVSREGLQDDETIRLELWLRNHHTRTLFLAVTTAVRQPKASDPLEKQPLDADEPSPEQLAFRQGRTVIGRPRRRGDAYAIATPVVLEGEGWHHLPVGIVTVTSNRADGTLATIGEKQDRLRRVTSKIGARLSELLMPSDE